MLKLVPLYRSGDTGIFATENENTDVKYVNVIMDGNVLPKDQWVALDDHRSVDVFSGTPKYNKFEAEIEV